MTPRISIITVFLDRHLVYFEKLINSIIKQNYKNLEFIIIDQTKYLILEQTFQQNYNQIDYHIIKKKSSQGFCQNNNEGINKSTGEYLLILNPDTYLSDRTISKFLDLLGKINNPYLCVAPLLLRFDKKSIDSAGMHINYFIRHKDIYSGKELKSVKLNLSYVWGFTGAAVFISKKLLEKIKFNNQFFDNDFWSYREDADLSWRIQNHGFEVIFCPDIVIYHDRYARPVSRKSIDPNINYHSLKNRYILMINNLRLLHFLGLLPFILIRELQILFYLLIFERKSLKSYLFIIKDLFRFVEKRRQIKKNLPYKQSFKWFFKKYKLIYNSREK